MQLRSSFTTRPFSSADVHKKNVCRVALLRANKTEKAGTKTKAESFSDGPDDAAPSTAEVRSLLDTLVSDTEIAELKLKMGSFQLSVRRSVDSASASAAPVAAATAPAAAVTIAAQPTMSPALSLSPMPYMSYDDSPAEESMDEYMVYSTASKVGIFRRGKYAAGKKIGKGNCANVGDQVKKGQTLGYIEQLGTFVEVKALQDGEIAQFKADEGDPVEYMQAVVAIAPFFAVQEAGVTEFR